MKFLNIVVKIFTTLTLISCIVPGPPKYIDYKIIENESISKDFVISVSYNYNYVVNKINSNIKIINISNERNKIKSFNYLYKSENYNICFDSIEILQNKLHNSSLSNIREVEILPKDTINLKMVCTKNVFKKVILENDTVSISFNLNNDIFKYKLIPIRK